MPVIRQQRLQERSNDLAISRVIERLLQGPKGIPAQSHQPNERPQQKNHANRSIFVRKGEGTLEVKVEPDHSREIEIDQKDRTRKLIVKSKKT